MRIALWIIHMKSTARQTHLVSNIRASVWLVALACALTGCTICQDCGDQDYPTYGSSWERTRRDSGRVGSIFDPAGARVATVAARESNAKDETARAGSNAKPNNTGSDPSSDPNNDDDGSPSDRTRDKDPGSLRDLELEDVNTETRDLLPPDV